jgi:ankyrin repeat protein
VLLKADTDRQLLINCFNRRAVTLIVRLLPSIDKNLKKGISMKDLHYAASSGNLEEVKKLTKTGIFKKSAPLDEVNPSGLTPLLVAAWEGHLPVVRHFIENCKVNINQMSSSGTTAWMYAAYGGRWADSSDAGMVREQQNQQNRLAVVKYFLENCNANVNQADNDGNTAVMLAAINGHLLIVKYLVEIRKCLLNNCDKEGKSIIDLAHSNVREYLEAYIKPIKKEISAGDKREEQRQREQTELLEGMKKLKAMQNNSTSSSNNNAAHKLTGVIDSMGQISLSLEIPYEELTVGKKLGQGGFGVVYQAKWQHADVAVKQLLGNNFSEEIIAEFKHETSVMAKLRNPHIIQLYGICIKQPYCMVMEFASKGSLHAVLHSNEQMDWPVRLKIAAGIAKGLAFLHNQKPMILHRDIKSMNVLLNTEMMPKLTDFGLAKIKDTALATTSTAGGSAAGTLHWMAPELLDRENPHYTTACEVYSLAILLWELSSRKMPYEGKTAKQIFASVVLREERETIPADSPPQFAALITNCWKQTAEDRPLIETIIQTLEQNMTDNKPAATKSSYVSFS